MKSEQRAHTNEGERSDRRAKLEGKEVLNIIEYGFPWANFLSA